MKNSRKLLLSISIFIILIVTGLAVANIERAQKIPPSTNQSYSGTFGMVWDTSKEKVVINDSWQDIANYTFYLPTNSYVNIESSGWMMATYLTDPCNSSCHAKIDIYISVDNNTEVDFSTYRSYNTENFYQQSNGQIADGKGYHGIQTNRVYYLNKGFHTVYLKGYITSFILIPVEADFRYISITAVANQNGNLEIQK